MHAFRPGPDGRPPHAIYGAQGKGRTIIGKSAVKVTQAGNNTVLLYPADGLRVVKARIHMHISP